jgi:hypothetical protein
MDAGTYRVCVHIDSDNSFPNETDENDNTVVLERPVLVVVP